MTAVDTARAAEPRPSRSIAELTGFEFVAGLAAGTIPRPPMAETLPFTLLAPDEGKVSLMARPEPRFFNLTRTVHGGWIMTMLDTVMALAPTRHSHRASTLPRTRPRPSSSVRSAPTAATSASWATWCRAAAPSSRWKGASRTPRASSTPMAHRRASSSAGATDGRQRDGEPVGDGAPPDRRTGLPARGSGCHRRAGDQYHPAVIPADGRRSRGLRQGSGPPAQQLLRGLRLRTARGRALSDRFGRAKLVLGGLAVSRGGRGASCAPSPPPFP